MTLSDGTPALQNASTAGVAGFVGGYLINLFNVLAGIAGAYAHDVLASIPADTLIVTDDFKVALASALGGYVLHRVGVADQANRLSPAERASVRELLAKPGGPVAPA